MILDARLEADSGFITNLDLCQVRLSHNAAFPWIILIPNKPGIIEIIDMNSADQHLLMDEIALASKIMRDLFSPTKLNVANLGNVVPQLHIHIIARYETDKAWPGPVWNSNVTGIYTSQELKNRIDHIRENFNNILIV